MNTTICETIRQAAGRLLSEEEVDVVIGYGPRPDGNGARAVFVRDAEEADQLIFDESCVQNLAVYLPREEIREMGRAAVVVKGCDRRAVNVLLRENVIEREDVHLIGVRCSGVGDPQPDKCAACEVHEPPDCDEVAGEPVETTETPASPYAAAEEIEEMSLEERWDFWQAQMGKCVRCYACRQACPLCYCQRCVVEKNVPRWVESSPHERGNLAWNLARAFHLTGRCVGCGECERVCPMDIPLTAINQKMAGLVDEWFDFRSGMLPDEEAPFSTFSEDDPEKDIL